jgi:CubicO group peptidase (beta-lactamase class C family)
MSWRIRIAVIRCIAAVAMLVAGAPQRGAAQQAASASPRGLSDGDKARIDAIVNAGLKASGTPSASIAVVRDGAIAYEQAYGDMRVTPKRPAVPGARYAIGSVSKQFTATAILLLAEDGKLSLDDRVAKWLPDLTRAGDITIRQLLSMTSGYQDYYPQDYVFEAMQKPVTARGILDQWAKKPLDFEPGTRWQYSNTNYTAAGVIIEKVTGGTLIDFRRRRVFTPLKMMSVVDLETQHLGDGDPARYRRNAVGPLRAAVPEAPGWIFAAGQLAMTAHDLALWDIAMIDQKLLRPASYREQRTDVLLTNGQGTRYGLGIGVTALNGHRMLSHGGAVSGFASQNAVFPDDRVAVVVFGNSDASPTGDLATSIANVVFDAADTGAAADLAIAKRMFAALQKGEVDRARLTHNADVYFTAEVLGDHRTSLGPLGAPTEFVQVNQNLRGGMQFRAFRVRAGGKALVVTMRSMPDGKIEQFLVTGTP